MYLQRLVEFAERERLVETAISGYAKRKLDWIIKISSTGEFEPPLRKLDKETYVVPYRIRSGSNLPPFLLYDKLDSLAIVWKRNTKNELRNVTNYFVNW
jgi:hypothetical protein